MDNLRKDDPDPKRSPKGTTPKNYKTYNVPNDDVENTKGINKGGDLRFANKLWIAPRGIEKMPQGSQKNTRASYIDQHILREGKVRGKTLAMAWIDNEKYIICSQKDSQNVLDIQIIHKVCREYHGKLRSGIDSRRKKLRLGKNPERNLLGRCTVTIIISNSDDSLNHILRKCTGEYTLNKS